MTLHKHSKTVEKKKILLQLNLLSITVNFNRIFNQINVVHVYIYMHPISYYICILLYILYYYCIIMILLYIYIIILLYHICGICSLFVDKYLIYIPRNGIK